MSYVLSYTDLHKKIRILREKISRKIRICQSGTDMQTLVILAHFLQSELNQQQEFISTVHRPSTTLPYTTYTNVTKLYTSPKSPITSSPLCINNSNVSNYTEPTHFCLTSSKINGFQRCFHQFEQGCQVAPTTCEK